MKDYREPRKCQKMSLLVSGKRQGKRALFFTKITEGEGLRKFEKMRVRGRRDSRRSSFRNVRARAILSGIIERGYARMSAGTTRNTSPFTLPIAIPAGSDNETAINNRGGNGL